MFGHSCISKCFKMATFHRILLAFALYIYQINRSQNMLRIQKSLSVLLFVESRRIFLIQQYLNHLKKLAMVDHFIRKKARRKPRSCRRFIRNQGLWETVWDTYDNNRFYETFRISCTTFYYILNKISDQDQKWWQKY